VTEATTREVRHWRIDGEIDLFDIAAPAEPGSMHCHSTYNIGAVIDGAASLETGGKIFEQPKGSVVLLNPFESHASSWTDSLNRYFVIYFSQEAWFTACSGLFPGLPPARLLGPVVQDRFLLDVMTNLRSRLLQDPQQVNIDAVTALIAACAARQRLVCDEETESSLNETARHRQLLQRSADDAFDPASNRIDEIAAEFGMSRFQFARRFRHNSGMPPRRFRVQMMVATAQRAISAGVSLVEAASIAGFSDQSHMSREFRRTYGMTPGEFQRVVASQLGAARSRFGKAKLETNPTDS
jgi:AraC-like DNA-binding protein